MYAQQVSTATIATPRRPRVFYGNALATLASYTLGGAAIVISAIPASTLPYIAPALGVSVLAIITLAAKEARDAIREDTARDQH